MTYCICLLQEGQIPEHQVADLGNGIHDIAAKHSLGTEPNISWIIVPKGQGWTAGQPSTSSVVTMMTSSMEQSQRVKILNDICNLWTERTGCHINEIIATVMPVE
ncbi:hypothetical protein HBA55_28250 [Pseudomaricurvus alkylphenolicus]|uniref:hypothetical protein n=1 Tax=Pseudomaricurvus alkylphenolicus TaxID=1306991 RepID=UPI0014235F83|nr:hypothetical protein [Pseudomaricurvus alkylphenolicus]NIB43533.1 hypothetical protein [Pseudomaricurvus alkylphenolicus]